MSELSERETIIICNRAEMAVGYFCLGTSEASDFASCADGSASRITCGR